MSSWALVSALLGTAGCKTTADSAERGPAKPKAEAESPAPAAAYDWHELSDEWKYPDPIPPFRLVDQDGREFSLGDYADRYVLVGFVFTSCGDPQACPLIMRKMREVQAAWADLEAKGATGGKRLQLLSLTLDPIIDQPNVFKKWAAGFGADFSNWTLATGPEELMTDDLPALFSVLSLPNAKGSIKHTVKIALLRPGLRDLKEWRNNELEASDVIQAVLEHVPEAEGA